MKTIYIYKPNCKDYRLWRPNYEDLILWRPNTGTDPILRIYVYRPYRVTLYKDIYIYKSFGKTKLIAKKTNLIAKTTN